MLNLTAGGWGGLILTAGTGEEWMGGLILTAGNSVEAMNLQACAGRGPINGLYHLKAGGGGGGEGVREGLGFTG